MTTPTIDHDPAVRAFRRLLEDDSPYSLLRLTGDAWMGKSHLVTRVFPEIVPDEGIPYVVLDLRQHTQTVRKLLYRIALSLRDVLDLSGYEEAERRITEPGPINVKGVIWVKSEVTLTTAGDPWAVDRHLTTQLAIDMGRGDRPVVLLIDAVEQAPPNTIDWLAQTLLPELCRLSRLRVVVAGQTLPEPAALYAHKSLDVHLEKVTDPRAYIAYCRDAAIRCPADHIPTVMRIVKFTPGLFVDGVAGVDWDAA